MATSCLCFFGNGEAYRFFAPDRDDPIVSAEDAVRWGTWGAGATLPWTLDTSADWSRWFGSSPGARRVIEQALTAWSDLPNADIRWEVAGEARSDYGSYGPRDRSANWVSINPNGDYGGAARTWSSRSGAGWRITGCTIVGGSWLDREPPDWWDSLPSLETETATMRLILEADSAAADVAFDWVGPYKDTTTVPPPGIRRSGCGTWTR